MNFIHNRIKFHSIFFKRLVTPSIAIGVAFGWLAQMSSHHSVSTPLIQMLEHALLFVPVGLLLCLISFELTRKEQYYFYYNQGISKIELWTVSFIFSFSFYYLFTLAVALWKHISKWIA